MGFVEFMNEEQAVNRWFVFKVAIVGAACGAALAVLFVLGGLGSAVI